MNNFNDEWNKLNKETQDAVRKKAQEKINSWYDPNKIASHIQNNFSTSPSSSNSSNKSSMWNSSFAGGNSSSTSSANYSSNTASSTPKFSTSSSNTWTNTMGSNYSPMDIPWVTPAIDRNTYKNSINNDINNHYSNWSSKSSSNSSSIKEADFSIPKIKPQENNSMQTINVNNNSKKQQMTELDRLLLDNIMSYNKPWRSVAEQNEVVRQRAERQNRINELQREENTKNKNNNYETAKIEKVEANKVMASNVNLDKLDENSLDTFKDYKAKTWQWTTSPSNNNVSEKEFNNDNKIVDIITKWAKESIANLKNSWNKVLDSIWNEINNIYEDTKWDIEKIKNIPTNVWIMLEDYYNQYVLWEEKEKEQDKWKDMTSEQFVDANEGRVWYFDTLTWNDLKWHAWLYFIHNWEEYLVSFYPKEPFSINPLKDWNITSQMHPWDLKNPELQKEQIKEQIKDWTKEGQLRNYIDMWSWNMNIESMVAWLNSTYWKEIPKYNLFVNNCADEVKNTLKAGWFLEHKIPLLERIPIDMPITLWYELKYNLLLEKLFQTPQIWKKN